MARNTGERPSEGRNMRPAMDPEAREAQLVSLAVDLAEQQLRDGTASSQVITHFLKLASTREAKEQAILESQNKLYQAKATQIEASATNDQMFKDEIEAFKKYSGAEDA